jgi:hypothetical protein
MTGRSFYRGGRGGGRGRGQGSSIPPKAHTKKTIEDYSFYIGSSKQASDYEVTAEFVINHIKKTFDYGKDIAEALRTLKKPDPESWEPAIQASVSETAATRDAENRQYAIKYKSLIDEVMRRTRSYENNTTKAYAILWERCAKAMQNKIASRTDFDTVVYDDPIALMRAIKEHSLNYQETRYEMSIILDAFRSVFTSKQQEGESLQDYTRRFKTAKEILESQLGGPLIMTKYVRTMKGFDQQDIEKTDLMCAQASEQAFAFLYLENADQGKYGTILTNLNSQKSLGNDQYPKTIVETNNVLSNHKLDVKKPIVRV